MRALNTWQQFGLCNMSSLASLKPSIYTECRRILIITAALHWLGFYATAVQSIARRLCHWRPPAQGTLAVPRARAVIIFSAQTISSVWRSNEQEFRPGIEAAGLAVAQARLDHPRRCRHAEGWWRATVPRASAGHRFLHARRTASYQANMGKVIPALSKRERGKCEECVELRLGVPGMWCAVERRGPSVG